MVCLISINISRAQTTLIPADHVWSNKDGWLVYRNFEFNGCFAENPQDDGTVFLLGVGEGGSKLVVGLASDQLTFGKTDESYTLKLSFDGRREWNTGFNILESSGRKILIGSYPAAARFRRDISRSNTLTISRNSSRLARLSLRGTRVTLQALDACLSAEPEEMTGVDQPNQGDEQKKQKAFQNDDLDPAEAYRLHALASEFAESDRNAEAAEHYQRALVIWENLVGPDHPLTADSLNGLGNVLQSSGDYDGAEKLYRRTLAIRGKAFGPDHPLVAASMNNLGNVLQVKGDHEGAELLHRRALAIREEALGPDHPDVGQSLNNLANLLEDKGEHDGTEPLYRRSLAIRERSLGPDHPLVGDSLNNLAILLANKGDYNGAEPLHRRALIIQEKALGPGHPRVGDSLNNLAVVLVRNGEYDGAEPLHRRALSIREKTLGRGHPRVGDSLNNLASLLNARGDPDEALTLASKAARSGNPKRGVYLLAIDNAGLSPGDELLESFVAVQQTASVSAGTALRSLAARFGAGSGELARLVREEQDQAAEVVKLEKAILTEISKAPAERDANGETAIRSRADELKASLGELRNRLSREFPEYAELSRPEALSLEAAQSLLAENEALVVIDVAATGEGSDYVWSITPQGGVFRRLNTQPGEIARMIAELRKSLDLDLHLARKPVDPSLAHRLYEKLLGPVANEIHGKSHLIFVLNGAVSSLPPHVLVSSAPETGDYRTARWLVHDHAITVLPTVSSLKILRSKTAGARAPKPFRGYADPVFNPERDGTGRQVASRSLSSFFDARNTDIDALREYLPRLPATAVEVKRVAESLGASPDEVVLRENATEAAVKQANLSEYNIIYFATHGLVAGDVEAIVDSGAEPALAFTVPDKASALDDGLLTASEVAQLDLNADWVVLSACNTAAGGEPGAEALSGLARAFFYAGTRSLLVSHWVVDDDATAELMSRTFAHASSNPSERPAEALRQAMLSMMNDTDHPEWADPAYWAPFILAGEPR